MIFLLISIGIASCIGFIIGAIELVQRYPETKYLFKKRVFFSTLCYCLFNSIISCASLFAIWSFRNVDYMNLSSINMFYICASGFGGMAILRSSIFTIKIKDENINIGLAQIVTIIMSAFDRKISTERAPIKLLEIIEISKGLTFEDMFSVISQCSVFTKHTTSEDYDKLITKYNEIKAYRNEDLGDKDKVIQILCEISELSDTKILSVISKNKVESNTDSPINESSTSNKMDIDQLIDAINEKIKKNESK